MPWKDSIVVVELHLWSILSTAAVVKMSPRISAGQTTCSLCMTVSPSWTDRRNSRSYVILTPTCESRATSSPFWLGPLGHQLYVHRYMRFLSKIASDVGRCSGSFTPPVFDAVKFLTVVRWLRLQRRWIFNLVSHA